MRALKGGMRYWPTQIDLVALRIRAQHRKWVYTIVTRTAPMPLSGEAIRMMNYIDDISTTLRRILALAPTLSAEERKRVGDYLKSSSPNADEAMAALHLK
jgi:hypothetical protein